MRRKMAAVRRKMLGVRHRRVRIQFFSTTSGGGRCRAACLQYNKYKIHQNTKDLSKSINSTRILWQETRCHNNSLSCKDNYDSALCTKKLRRSLLSSRKRSKNDWTWSSNRKHRGLIRLVVWQFGTRGQTSTDGQLLWLWTIEEARRTTRARTRTRSSQANGAAEEPGPTSGSARRPRFALPNSETFG